MKTLRDTNDDYCNALRDKLLLQKQVADTTQIDQLREENRQLKELTETQSNRILELENEVTALKLKCVENPSKSEHEEPSSAQAPTGDKN